MNKLGYIFVVILLLMTCIFSIDLFYKQRNDNDAVDMHNFPHTIDVWQGEDFAITEKEYDILETRNLISRDYVNGNTGEKIHLFIIYSETNRSVFHPPEVCFIGSGITIADKKDERIDTKKLDFLANKLYLEKNDCKEISLYCYKVGDFYTGSYYLQQVYFAINQLLGLRRGGATIRTSMRRRYEDESYELITLKDFMKKVITTLEKLSCPQN